MDQTPARQRKALFQGSGHLTKYIFPAFGHIPLSKINRVKIERWLVDLPLANLTKNGILYTFRIIMREAELENLIQTNPLEKIEAMGKTSKARDAFTMEELRTLFPEEKLKLIEIWKTEKYAIAFSILATIGLHSGELRALQWKDVLWDGGLSIEKSVKVDQTIGTTKTNEARVVLLTSRALKLLAEWREESPYSEMSDFIFFGPDGEHPMDRGVLLEVLKHAMKICSINTEGRNLVVHSFRHTFNTLMRRVLPQATLQAITGHKTEQMSAHYDHPTREDLFNSIRDSQKSIEGVLK